MKKGKRRTFWIPDDLDGIIEDVRVKIGLTRSGFFRYAVVKLLHDIGILSSRAKEETVDE